MRFTHLLLGLGVTLVAGCAKHTNDVPIPESAPAVLIVENNAYLDRTIYIVRSGLRERLGIAPGHQTTTFTIPRKYVLTQTPLSFLADPIGAAAPTLEDGDVINPGDQIVLTINALN